MSSAAGFQSFIPKEPSMLYNMSNVQQQLSDVTLGPGPWAEDVDKLRQFESLKNVALGNCRLLYGSERGKFYDFVVGVDDNQSTFCVALVCNRESTSKVLRTSVSDCPVKATHTMVNQLQKDTMPLLMNHGAGCQMTGQLGYTHDVHGKFELGDGRNIERLDGPVDATDTLPINKRIDSYIPYNAPRAPRADRPGHKRARREVDRYPDPGASDGRWEHDRFSEPRTPTDIRMAAAEPGEIIGEDYYDEK